MSETAFARVPPDPNYVPHSYEDCVSYFTGHYFPVWECTPPPKELKYLTQPYHDWIASHCPGGFGYDTRDLDPAPVCKESFSPNDPGTSPPPPPPPPSPNHSCGGSWSYEINPESTDQFECKYNGHIVSGWKSCNEDGSCENHDLIVANCHARCDRGEFGNLDPGTSPGPQPVGAQFLVDLSFSNLRSCTAKVDVIKSATDSIAASGATDKIASAEAFCHTLYPLGAGQTLQLTAALSANYTFTDADDCVTKTSATEAEATSVKRETSAGALADVGDPQSYCTGLFPGSPPTPPPAPDPNHKGAPGSQLCHLRADMVLQTTCTGSPPPYQESAAADEDACTNFCGQKGAGYCTFIPMAKYCSWTYHASNCSYSLIPRPENFAHESVGVCGDAPLQ
ncbi:MAG: hypothetical protein ACXVB9_17625 [Bdellovibrionota bacterium]